MGIFHSMITRVKMPRGTSNNWGILTLQQRILNTLEQFTSDRKIVSKASNDYNFCGCFAVLGD